MLESTSRASLAKLVMPIQYLVPIQTNPEIRSVKCTCHFGESRVFFQGSGVAKFCSQIRYSSLC